MENGCMTRWNLSSTEKQRKLKCIRNNRGKLKIVFYRITHVINAVEIMAQIKPKLIDA
jgi:hypothetical protein